MIASLSTWPSCLALVVVLVAGCSDDECKPGYAKTCAEHSGPTEVKWCQADGTLSECIPFAYCDPLAQTGCPSSLVCYATHEGSVCADAELVPCPAGEAISDGICRPHCIQDESGQDRERCAEEESCSLGNRLPEGMGTCTPEPSYD